MTSDGHSDAELIARFQAARDFAAFNMLFDRHKRHFLAYLMRLTGGRSAAEDISQQCWLKIVELARQGGLGLTGNASFRSLLYTMGRNRFLDEHVRRHDVSRVDRLDAGVLELAGDDSAAPDAWLAEDEQRQRLHAAISALPLDQRDVIALWSAGVSIAEMTAITGAPRDTVLSRKKYALKKLKAAVAAEPGAVE